MNAIARLQADERLRLVAPFTPHLIAVAHLFVLGFISSIVMGAKHQLVPVTLEAQLHSKRLVKWQFAHSNVMTLLDGDGEISFQQAGLDADPQAMAHRIEQIIK